MQMQNTRISITPLNIHYNTRKPFSILLKLKRILISTNYQLEKWQCKKQFPLKDGYVDMAPYAHTTTLNFKLSKQLEIGNTKIDLIVFGFLNKDVNLLGISTLDLGLFQHENFQNEPYYKEMKLILEKSQDPKAYITVGIYIQNISKNSESSQKKQSKGQQQDMNTLKTQSYNKESLLLGRRKQTNIPTVYQISRQNYKQVEITRALQDKSRQNSRNRSGSYKKRFEYQYSRLNTTRDRDQDQQPQPPPKRHQTKQQRGSPMPRMKTPEPITDFHSSVESVKILSKPKNQTHQNPNTYNSLHNNTFNQNIHLRYSQKYETNPQNKSQDYSRGRHKIIIDVQHSKIQGSPVNLSIQNQEDLSQQNKDSYNIEVNEKENINKWQAIKFKKQKPNQGRIQPNIRKNQGGISPSSSSKKQNRLNNQNFKENIEQVSPSTFKQLTYEQIKRQRERQKQRQRQKQRDKQRQKQREQNYQVNRSKDGGIFDAVTSIQIVDNSIKRPSKPQTQRTNKQSNKSHIKSAQRSNQSPGGDKFKDIAQKLQAIEEKINQGKKSSPGIGKKSINQSLSKNKGKGYSSSPRKVQKANSKDQDKTKLQSSANTFKEHFQSNMESSPTYIERGNDHNISSDARYVQSFNYEPQDEEKEETIKLTGRFKEDNHDEVSQKYTNEKQKKLVRSQNFKKPQSQMKQSDHLQSIDTFGKNSQNVYESSVAHFQLQMHGEQRQNKKQFAKKVSTNENQKFDRPLKNKVEYKNDECQTQMIKRSLINQSIQTSAKKPQKVQRQPHYQLTKNFQLKILPAAPASLKLPQSSINLTKSADIKPSVDQTKKLQKKYQQKITTLENQLDQQQQTHRKILMQKQLQYRNQLKQFQKNQQKMQQQLQQFKAQNAIFKQKQIKYENQLKQSNGIKNKQYEKLKEQYVNLKKLNDKLSAELDESDTKQFELLTQAQKKDMQFKKKLDDLNETNEELAQELKNKEKQINELREKLAKMQEASSNIPQTTQSAQVVKQPSIISNQSDRPKSQQQLSTLQKQNLAMKKQMLVLQRTIREKDNQIKFMNIRNETLEQQKKDLENQIDNIAANNKLEMARQGSINKLNLQSASISNNIKIQNQILKEQIGSLQKQVKELNNILEGIINQGSVDTERLSQSKQTAHKQNYQALLKKYEALQKINEANQQEIKKKQNNTAQIINLVFSHGDQKLMDQIQKFL